MNTVLVTGANKGIGREVARQLAAKGFHVVLTARDREAGRQAAEALTGSGGRVDFLPLDVTDDASVHSAARDFAKISDSLDVLINNAGILLEGDNDILKSDLDLVRQTIETNTLGPLRVTRAFARALARSRAARVINVSSGGGQLTGGADGWAPAYCTSKTALNGVTVQLAAALPNVAVNSVCPGWVRTDMGGANATGSVEEGADTIVWLAADAPHELTGKFFKERKEIPW